MRKHIILFCLIILSAPCFAQTVTKTVGIVYTAGAPTHVPAAKVGSQVAIDTVAWTWYEYNGSAWVASGDKIQSISGCSAPNYTPTKYQSAFVVNACTVLQNGHGPELYQYAGSAWECLNCVDGLNLTAGSGITLTGTAPDITISNSAPDISISLTEGDGIGITGTYPDFTVTNSAPNVVQTLSIAGQDLTLSNGGGTVAIPAGSSIGTGFTAGGGTGTIPDGTIAQVGSNSLVFVTANARNISGAIGTKRDADNYSLTGIYDDVDGQFVQFFSGKEGDVKTEYLVDYNGLSVSASGDNNATNVSILAGPYGVTIANTFDGFGATYAAEYPGILTNDRSIPDVGLTKTLIAANWPLLAPNGSAGSPSYSFASASSSGMYFDKGAVKIKSAGDIQIKTDNLENSAGSITAQAGNSEEGSGGSFYLGAGNSASNSGGGFTLNAGSGFSGGTFGMNAGSSNGIDQDGGSFEMRGGLSENGPGGGFRLYGGVSLSGNGGNVNLYGGEGVSPETNGVINIFGNGLVYPILTSSEISSLTPNLGQSVYCSDCTATDASTGVQQVWNGSTWKNAW